MEGEEWHVIGRFWEYEVSNLGRVRRIDSGHVKDPTIRKDGRLTVHLTSGKKSSVCQVHSLVAEAFIGPRPRNQIVRFKDGDTQNCRAANLYYVRRSEVTPLFPPPTQKLSSVDVARIRYLLGEGVKANVIAAAFGISESHLSNIRNSKKWVAQPGE